MRTTENTLAISIEANGETVADIEMALEEITARIVAGFTSGFDENETGRFSFSLTGVLA